LYYFLIDLNIFLIDLNIFLIDLNMLGFPIKLKIL